MAPPTLREVLALPEVRRGSPVTLTPDAWLDRPVRWVHVSELTDVDTMLSGSELILTTGIALPDVPAALAAYVDRLARAGAAGLVLELVRRYDAAPPALVDACRRAELPLVTLRREIPFVRITEAVHARIVAEQLASLRASERAHAEFTRLTVAGAGAGEIVAAAARMAGAPGVAEDLMRRVVAYDPGPEPVADLLRNWSRRSRVAGWPTAEVSASSERFGRLVLVTPDDATPTQMMVLERAAQALTLSRLVDRRRESMERSALRSLLADVRERRAAEADLAARADALGVAPLHRHLAGVVVVPGDAPTGGHRDAVGRLLDAISAARLSTLAGPLDSGRVGVLVSFPSPDDRRDVLAALADRIHASSPGSVIGVGSTVVGLADAARSFAEAEHVVLAVPGAGASDAGGYLELPDTHLGALLYTLLDDPRLQSYVDRTIGPLESYDLRHRTELVAALRVLLATGGNKASAAAKLGLSRQALYDRLALAGRVLGLDLDDPLVATSLHTAIMALDLSRRLEDS